MVNYAVFLDNRTKVIMAASYYRGKVLDWIQPYIIKLLEKGWVTGVSQDTVNLLIPANFILQLQTVFGEINPKQKTKEKRL